MLKQWFLRVFFRRRILLENILVELRMMHYHLDNIDKSEKTIDNPK